MNDNRNTTLIFFFKFNVIYFTSLKASKKGENEFKLSAVERLYYSSIQRVN